MLEPEILIGLGWNLYMSIFLTALLRYNLGSTKFIHSWLFFKIDSNVQPGLRAPGRRLAGGCYTLQMEDARELEFGRVWVKMCVDIWGSDAGEEFREFSEAEVTGFND